MFKHFKSLEALTATTGSPLFRDITNLCNATLEQLEGGSEGVPYSTRIISVQKFLTKGGFIRKLAEILKARMGLVCTEIIIDTSSYPNAFACMMPKQIETFGELDIVNARAYGIDPFFNHSGWFTDKNLETELQKAHDKLNDDTAQFSADFSRDWYIYLGIEACLFLIGDYYHLKFTGENIAAIILHELGHIVTEMKQMAYFKHTSALAREVLDYTNTCISVSNALDILTECQGFLKDTPSHAVKNSSEYRRTMKGLNSLIEYFTNEKPTALTDEQLIDVKVVVKAAVSLYYTAWSFGPLQFTDSVQTDTNEVAAERSADRFAVRNGAGAAMVEAMATFHKLYEKTPNPTKNIGDVMMKINNTLNCLATVSSYLETSACFVCSSYDPIMERLQYMIKETAMVFVHNPGLSKEERDAYLIVIDRAKAALEDYHNQKYVKAREAYYNFISNIGGFIAKPFSMFSSHLISQYTVLQDFTQDIIQNSLHYNAARLGRIHDRL